MFSPLNVNLTGTAPNPSQRLPVFVYIHGGAFTGGRGTSSGYEGNELASVTNMVVVAINYRLGKIQIRNIAIIVSESEFIIIILVDRSI